jgi:hypothetical protein
VAMVDAVAVAMAVVVAALAAATFILACCK